MCPETTDRTLRSGNIELNGCYRQVAPPEQKHACCVSFSFNQTCIINQFLISNSRYSKVHNYLDITDGRGYKPRQR